MNALYFGGAKCLAAYNIHPLNIVKVQYPDTGDQRPRQARPLGGSRGSAVPPLGWGMCTPRKKGKVVIRQLLKGFKKNHTYGSPSLKKITCPFFVKMMVDFRIIQQGIIGPTHV